MFWFHLIRLVYAADAMFAIVGAVVDVETIATGREIRELRRFAEGVRSRPVAETEGRC